MKLGDYYDSVLAESEKIASADAVEQTKIAEAAEILDNEGRTFADKTAAEIAIKELIENDYAEKVAAVMTELDIDKVTFETQEEKVASAMEIVDGWEKVAMKGVGAAKKVAGKFSKFMHSGSTASKLVAAGGAGAAGGAATRVLERDKKDA